LRLRKSSYGELKLERIIETCDIIYFISKLQRVGIKIYDGNIVI
jgi:hypothetical protein